MAEPGQDPTLQRPSAAVDPPPTPQAGDGTTHIQDEIEAESVHTDDEGYQESSTSSLLSSIATEIAKGKVEHGRTYAVYGTHEYQIPIDDDELDRLDMNHYKYNLCLGGHNYLAPIGDDPQRILDIGTGTGIWAIDMADKFPSAEVVGTDLAPIQPQWVPPNCHFQVDDAESQWTWPRDNFDFIHLRDMYHAIRDWKRLVQQCYDHTKPGGYVEFVAVHPAPLCDDGTLDPNGAYMELVNTWDEIGSKIACEPLSATKFKQWFIDGGFENVEEHIFKIPCSPWPKDPTLKKIGAYELMNVLEGAKGFLLKGWVEVAGKSKESLEMMLYRTRKELASNKNHSYISFYVTYGRKPQSPSQQRHETPEGVNV